MFYSVTTKLVYFMTPPCLPSLPPRLDNNKCCSFSDLNSQVLIIQPPRVREGWWSSGAVIAKQTKNVKTRRNITKVISYPELANLWSLGYDAEYFSVSIKISFLSGYLNGYCPFCCIFSWRKFSANSRNLSNLKLRNFNIRTR